MDVESKKGADLLGGISSLNKLIIALEEAELKLEQSYKKNKPEQLQAIKEFILKLQKKISEEIK
jgi:hypothetical protein